jgi:hypothetical protein
MNEVHKNIAVLEKELGKKFGSQRQPAARVRPFGRRGVDARHDEHDPEPGPDRRAVAGLAAATKQRPLRVRRVPPPDQHVRRRRDGRRPHHFEDAFDKIKAKYNAKTTPTSPRRA